MVLAGCCRHPVNHVPGAPTPAPIHSHTARSALFPIAARGTPVHSPAARRLLAPGCTGMTAIRLAILSLLVLSAGCDRVRVQLPPPAVPGSLPRVTPEPDPATAGIVTGSVNWLGERPEVPPLHVSKITPSGGDWVDLPNPNAPHFSADGGI